MAPQPFSVRLNVRVYELDPQGHVSGGGYLQYAYQAFSACLRAAGIAMADLSDSGVAAVNLESTIRYHKELREGDEFAASCAWLWGEGRTYRIKQVLRRADGALAAKLSHLSGLVDLDSRGLVADPVNHWRKLAKRPEVLGLPDA